MQSTIQATVIDKGSTCCRAGISGNDLPKSCFSPEEKKHEKNNIIQGVRGFFTYEQKMQHGLINTFDDFEKILHRAYYDELKIFPEEQPCLLAQVPLTNKVVKEKITQIVFETFNIPLFNLSNSAVLSLLASGRTIGEMIESGENATYSVPIYEGCCLGQAVLQQNLAGKDCSNYLKEILNFEVTTDILREIKEKLCFVNFDPLIEVSNSFLQLPDGNQLTINSESRFQCPEILFQPQLSDQIGIHQQCVKSIISCDNDLQRFLSNNVILSGGNSLFKGMKERLQQEVSKLMDSKCKVIAPVERRLSTWIGGSILATKSQKDFWISSSEYNDYGPQIVHIKS